jgi:hypothetical protein
MNTKKLFILAASLLAPLFAHAACETHLSTWMNALHPDRTLDTDHAVCEVWPANPAYTLAALPLAHKDGKRFDLDVVVSDSASGVIVTHLYQPDAIGAGHARFIDIAFDTAPYRVSADRAAFGLRVSYETLPGQQPEGATMLNLYVMDGESLRQVLGNFMTASAKGEWDGKCKGFFDATTRTLDMTENGAVKVSQTTTRTVSKSARGQCVSREGAPAR